MSGEVLTKVCSVCDRTKNLESFARQPSGKFGVAKQCKECRAALTREKRKTPEEKEKLRQYYLSQKDKPETQAYQARYRKTEKAAQSLAATKARKEYVEAQRDYAAKKRAEALADPVTALAFRAYENDASKKYQERRRDDEQFEAFMERVLAEAEEAEDVE